MQFHHATGDARSQLKMYLPIKDNTLNSGFWLGRSLHLLHAEAHAHAVMERHSKTRQNNNEDKKHHLSGRGEVLVEGIQHYSAAEGTIHFHISSTLTKETGLNLDKESDISFSGGKQTFLDPYRQAIPNLLGMPHLHFQWES